LTLWNRIEQYFKCRYMPWLEKVFGREELSPQDVDFSTVKRILVIRQHDMLGDFILATPVLRALRQKFPQAHIGVVVRNYYTGVVSPHPFVDEAVVFYEHGIEWTPRRLRTFWRQLRNGWDLTIVLNTVSHSFTSDLIAHFSRARYVLGSAQRVFLGCTRNFFYNLIAPYDEAHMKHQSERNLDIVRHVGVDTDDSSEVMQMLPAERQAARNKLAAAGVEEGKLLIGMHVGAGKVMNRWPVSHFAELARRLHDDFDAQILLFWGANEAGLAEQFLEKINFEPIKGSPGGLRELSAYFANCDMLICNDTGVMHIGAAVGVPLLAIFGPTDPKEWKPIGKNFIALRGENGKIENVTVDQAYAALVSAFQSELVSLRASAAAY